MLKKTISKLLNLALFITIFSANICAIEKPIIFSTTKLYIPEPLKTAKLSSEKEAKYSQYQGLTPYNKPVKEFADYYKVTSKDKTNLNNMDFVPANKSDADYVITDQNIELYNKSKEPIKVQFSLGIVDEQQNPKIIGDLTNPFPVPENFPLRFNYNALIQADRVKELREKLNIKNTANIELNTKKFDLYIFIWPTVKNPELSKSKSNAKAYFVTNLNKSNKFGNQVATLYLTWDGKTLRPQTGPLFGKLNKTDSGYSLLSNVGPENIKEWAKK